MLNFAFLGTGQCDPNKGLLQFLAAAGFLAGWSIVIYIIHKIKSNKMSSWIKVAIIGSMIFLAVCVSIVIFLAVWIGLACGRN
jgi:hypothetical protein